ncbi:hypothetical protein ACUY3D_02775 [Corynebacterium guaraldiae]
MAVNFQVRIDTEQSSIPELIANIADLAPNELTEAIRMCRIAAELDSIPTGRPFALFMKDFIELPIDSIVRNTAGNAFQKVDANTWEAVGETSEYSNFDMAMIAGRWTILWNPSESNVSTAFYDRVQVEIFGEKVAMTRQTRDQLKALISKAA